MTYGDFKYSHGKTFHVKVLCDKTFNIAKIKKYDEYKRGFASTFYKCFDKKNLLLLTQEQELTLIKILRTNN